jgi:hypothetical protein
MSATDDRWVPDADDLDLADAPDRTTAALLTATLLVGVAVAAAIGTGVGLPGRFPRPENLVALAVAFAGGAAVGAHALDTDRPALALAALAAAALGGGGLTGALAAVRDGTHGATVVVFALLVLTPALFVALVGDTVSPTVPFERVDHGAWVAVGVALVAVTATWPLRAEPVGATLHALFGGLAAFALAIRLATAGVRHGRGAAPASGGVGRYAALVSCYLLAEAVGVADGAAFPWTL